MKPSDYGLVYYKGEFRFFTKYRVITERHGTQHIEITLPTGRKVKIHQYFSKRSNRMIEAIDAIHKYPSQIINTGESK